VPVTIFLCSAIVGTNRRFWFASVDDPEPLKRLPDADRIARLEALGLAEDADAAEREALSEAEISALSGPLVDFQSHGRSHPILPRCDGEKARREIVDSRRELTERYGLDVYAFAYPNGEHSSR